jgi:hypothetical protein
MYTMGFLARIRIVALGTLSETPVEMRGAVDDTTTEAGNGRIVAV